MNKRLRKGDQVLVIKGNDRGKVGKILLIKKERVVVEGVNVRKKHMKKTQENQKGQIIDIESPIQVSNVRVCVDEKPVKLRTRVSKEGSREFYYLDANKKPLVYRSVKNEKSK